jgi:hypothetical protein
MQAIFPEKDFGEHQILLRDSQGHLVPATVKLGCRDWSEKGLRQTECRITLHWAGGTIEEMDWNFFASFKRVREQLSLCNLLPLCYGSSRRIVLSGMSIDMSLGLNVYKVSEDGQLCRSTVHIFDSGDDLEAVSVASQEQFQDEWRKSR